MDEATQEQIPAVLNPEDILSRLQAMRHSCGPSEDALIGFLLDNPEVSSHATIRSL